MALALLLAGAAATACSVKEDRGLCPCWLEIDLSSCAGITDAVNLKGWSSGKPVLGTAVRETDFGIPYEAEVPRGTLDLCAYSGVSQSLQSGMAVVIPQGRQCDSLWAYRSTVITDGESAYEKVHLHKQFATLSVDARPAPGMTLKDLSVIVGGNWMGIDLNDLSPVPGGFLSEAVNDKDGLMKVRLPRQGDDTLLLNLVTSDSTETIEIGKTIDRMGYDWKALDLDDILVKIDWDRGVMTVSIDGWNGGTVTEEII